MTKISDPLSPQEQNLLGFVGRRPSMRPTKRPTFQGPLRAVRLCLLCILIPGLLISVPLYLRYHVYYKQEYPLSMSDMRMINAHVSTTWCQRQLVRANTTFNAYVVDGTPGVIHEPKRVSMTRQLVLEDDMKEYWAFYLLKGSTVTVSTCVRWQGASLIIIKGHKHLRECAYIGDDSSEEEDEVQEELAATQKEKAEQPGQDTSSEAVNKTNTPKMMRRLRPGIQLHHLQDPLKSQERLAKDDTDVSDDDDDDNILARVLLRKATDNVKFKRKSVDLDKVYKDPNASEDRTVESQTGGNKTQASSSEVFEEVLKKIKLLGARGKHVLTKLNSQLGDSGNQELQEKIRMLLENDDERSLQENGTVSVAEMLNQTISEQDKVDEERRKREIKIGQPQLHALFNKHDEEMDTAIEEDLEPDGIADHHRTLNETTNGDHSNSEFWSSFSSSEEALLKCAGLVLNLPLTPHRRCEKHRTADEHANAALANTITYKVSSTGYYFFVFSSENEIQPNYFRVHFELEKTVYNVSNPVYECKNATDTCTLPLTFWSSDTVVLELPVSANDAAWNEDFVVISTCEPRTALFLACVISVPLVILLFAFH